MVIILQDRKTTRATVSPKGDVPGAGMMNLQEQAAVLPLRDSEITKATRASARSQSDAHGGAA